MQAIMLMQVSHLAHLALMVTLQVQQEAQRQRTALFALLVIQEAQ